ncbi:MAG: DNA polymerase III subunit gamma/tau [Chitinispirillaceae bacterium]|nr:DNA polymerase III subunit gamma/tau [Chitinispirillaceae bacterium]
MSYLVFARKWRPPTFDDVVGQEHITATLKKAIEKNRVAHAYLFTGTRGVGKTTTARILAKALNCEKGPTPDPCGECPSCRDIARGSSFDVLEIDGASNNSVNDIRELRENIGYSSMGGKHRIFVIDEVHMLSNSAFNALLKTLEEPPNNVIFIFATTEPQKIPATIHSRCQRYDFRRIDANNILERLIRICTEEKITYEKQALVLVARKADGSMRDALSLLDQVYSFCQDHLTEKEVRSVLGLVGIEVYQRIMDAVDEKKPAIVLGLVQEVLHQGFDFQEFIAGLQEHLRNLLFTRIPDALMGRGIDLDEESAAPLIRSAQRFSEGDLLRMTEIVRKTEHEIKWSAFPRFLVEIMMLKLVYLDRTVSIEQMVKLFGSGPDTPAADHTAPFPDEESSPLKKKMMPISESAPLPCEVTNSPTHQAAADHRYETAGGKAPDGSVHEAPFDAPLSATAPEITNEGFNESSSDTAASPDISAFWPSFLEALLRDRPKLGSFLSLASVAACSSHSIDLTFSPSFKFQFQELSRKQNREEITRILHTVTNRLFDVRMTLETETSDAEKPKYITQVTGKKVTINDEIEHEPIIQSLMDMFDGEVME